MTSDVTEKGCAIPVHGGRLFLSSKRRLDYLEIWRELGVRPSLEQCCVEDRELLNLEIDNIAALSSRCIEARRLMNDALPPHELARDDDLMPMPSGIQGAGKGLFFRPTSSASSTSPSLSIRKDEIICYYCGHLHDFHSRKVLRDISYLMLVSGDLFVDPGPLAQIMARYINDPLNERYVNCQFVAQPDKRRCAVVATRDIEEGEELFVSYGEAYWSQKEQEATIYSGPKFDSVQ